MSRRGGTISLTVDGEVQDAKGDFTCNAGRPKKEGIVGADRMHGYKETPMPGSIKGKITDRGTLDLDVLQAITDGSIACELPNGKVFMLRHAYYAGEGELSTGEGEFDFNFEGEGEWVS